MLKTIGRYSLIVLAAFWLLVTSIHAGVMIYGSFTDDYHSVFTVGGRSCLVVIKGGKSAAACVPQPESN